MQQEDSAKCCHSRVRDRDRVVLLWESEKEHLRTGIIRNPVL